MNRTTSRTTTRAHRLLIGLFTTSACVSLTAALANPPCPSDLDGSRVVDTADLSLLLLDFGACAGCASDLDGSGEVDSADTSVLLLDFGACPTWYTVLQHEPDPAVIYDATLRAAIAATGLPWRVRHNGTGIEMLLIPPGSFVMGCSRSWEYLCNSSENPNILVTLTSAFYIGRFEVTQAQWISKMETNPSYCTAAGGLPGSNDRPVERVSWNDVTSFNSQAELRLPTEAEWEYAYRAGTTTAFHGRPTDPTGSNEDDQLVHIAWFHRNNRPFGTKAVGTQAANGFGLHDMAGNVSEWVNDWMADGYDGSGTVVDPTGPSTGIAKVWRGGGWAVPSGGCRASVRYGFSPTENDSDIGFRVARNP